MARIPTVVTRRSVNVVQTTLAPERCAQTRRVVRLVRSAVELTSAVLLEANVVQMEMEATAVLMTRIAATEASVA